MCKELVKLDDVVAYVLKAINEEDRTLEQTEAMKLFAEQVRALETAEELVKAGREKLKQLFLDNAIEKYTDRENGVNITLKPAYSRSDFDRKKCETELWDMINTNLSAIKKGQITKEIFMENFKNAFGKNTSVSASVAIKAY